MPRTVIVGIFLTATCAQAQLPALPSVQHEGKEIWLELHASNEQFNTIISGSIIVEEFSQLTVNRKAAKDWLATETLLDAAIHQNNVNRIMWKSTKAKNTKLKEHLVLYCKEKNCDLFVHHPVSLIRRDSIGGHIHKLDWAVMSNLMLDRVP